MLKTKHTVIAIGLATMILLGAGCSTRSKDYGEQTSAASHDMVADGFASNGFTGAVAEDSYTEQKAMETPQTGAASSPEMGNNGIAANVSDRKVITNIDYTIQTITYDDSRKKLDALIAETGSFVQSSGIGGSVEGGDAYSRLTIRVPADKLDAFKQAVEDIGNVISRNESGRDATAEFYDSQARIKVLKAQEDRVLLLLDRAENVEEIMLIENELTRIRTEIEQLTTTVNRINDLTEYATVTISLDQTKVLTPIKTSFWAELTTLFKDSFNGFVGVLAGIGSVFVWLLPYIVIGGIIVIVVVHYARKHKKAIVVPPQDNETKN